MTLPLGLEGCGNALMTISLYVDGLMVAGNDMTAIACMKTELTKRFEMKDLGEPKPCFRLNISRSKPGGSLGQRKQSLQPVYSNVLAWKTADL